MALIPCPECGKQVSDKAPACPNCAFPVREYLSKKPSAPPPAEPVAPVQPPAPSKPRLQKSGGQRLSHEKLVQYAIYAIVIGLVIWWLHAQDKKQKAREHFRQNYSTAVDILNELKSRQLQESDKAKVVQAVKLLEEAQAFDPKDPNIPYALGAAQQRLHNWDEALESYETALRLKPDFPDAYRGIGNVYAAIALPEKAIEAYQNEIRLRPEKPEAYARLGNVYYDNQRWNEAIEAYSKFTELAPQNASGYVSLGQAFYKAKRYTEAVKTLEQGLARDSLNTPLIYDLGLAYVATGNRENAEKMLEMLRALNAEEYAAKLVKMLGN